MKKVHIAFLPLLLISSAALANSTSNEKLTDRLQAYQGAQDTRAEAASEESISDLIGAVAWIRKNHTPVACVETSFVRNSAKFATSYDAAGKPCKIYDLSFPTLRTLFASNPVADLPLQNFSSDDYLAWLDGNYDFVQKRISEFSASPVTQAEIEDSWLSHIRFKRNSGIRAAANGLPESFRMSDVALGTELRFNAAQKRDLARLFAEAKSLTGDNDAVAQTLETYVNDPEQMLSKIKFNWNALKKAYEIFLEMDFLPIAGPIDLVDYNTQYKFIVEKYIRTAVLKALNYIAGNIPSEHTQRFVKFALTEAFGFIEQAYDYHLNAMEDTLRLNLSAELPTQVAHADVERGLQILFAQKISLVQAYLTAKITGQKINFNELYKQGAAQLYSTDKQREILRAELNSELTLKKNCQMSLAHNYFGICSKAKNNGEVTPVALYTLLTRHNVYFWSLGAPKLHSYGFGPQILMMRTASYILSAASTLYDLPIPNFLRGALAKLLKEFAMIGVTDQAFLLNYLTEMKNAGLSKDDSFGKNHISWLFLNNVNPFLTKSEASENGVIIYNAKLLQKKVGNN